MISLGFKPSKRSSIYKKKYDTLIYPINDTDFIYTGYNQFSKTVSNKILWKSFKQQDTGERITYPVVHLGDTGYTELKAFLGRCNSAAEYNAEMAVESYTKEEMDDLTNEAIQTSNSNG